jgi:hypothetical protein
MKALHGLPEPYLHLHGSHFDLCGGILGGKSYGERNKNSDSKGYCSKEPKYILYSDQRRMHNNVCFAGSRNRNVWRSASCGNLKAPLRDSIRGNLDDVLFLASYFLPLSYQALDFRVVG